MMLILRSEQKMINLTLKDGSVRQVAKGTTLYELASSLSQGLARVAVASIGALLAARLGFARVIGTIYPVMGFIGLFFLASILWAQVREYIAGK
jgi:uncharacterized membrane protein YkvI